MTGNRKAVMFFWTQPVTILSIMSCNAFTGCLQHAGMKTWWFHPAEGACQQVFFEYKSKWFLWKLSDIVTKLTFIGTCIVLKIKAELPVNKRHKYKQTEYSLSVFLVNFVSLSFHCGFPISPESPFSYSWQAQCTREGFSPNSFENLSSSSY